MPDELTSVRMALLRCRSCGLPFLTATPWLRNVTCCPFCQAALVITDEDIADANAAIKPEYVN